MSITNCDVIASDMNSARQTQLLSPEIASSNEWKCSSAPQSRAGSFKKTRRSNYNESSRASLPSLEDSIIAKLEQLKQLEQDNCCAVRQFETSSRGIVNRGDSFRHRKTTPHVSKVTDHSGLFVDEKPSGPQRQSSFERTRVVMIIGDHGVGKTALLQQFMTSQYMAAMNTSFDIDSDIKTLSVLLNDEETLINFVDVETSSEQNYPDVHCYILLYSITDRKSFEYVIDFILQRRRSEVTRPVILVGNKNDVVRKRQVSDKEAIETCMTYGFKFICVSAILNHRLDELLVGVVSQLRHYYGPHTSSHVTDGKQTTVCVDKCVKSPVRGLLNRLLFTRHTESRQPCENLMTL